MGPCTEERKRSDIEMSELLKIHVCVEINDAQRTAKIYRDCALMQKSFIGLFYRFAFFFFSRTILFYSRNIIWERRS